MISKIIKSEFSTNDNPLSKLGFLFARNQFLYILIAIWVYRAVLDKMVMVLAVTFGAHLLPFGWLYKSKAYSVISIIISFTTLVVGVIFNPIIVSVFMVVMEIIFSAWLISEVKNNNINKLINT